VDNIKVKDVVLINEEEGSGCWVVIEKAVNIQECTLKGLFGVDVATRAASKITVIFRRKKWGKTRK
jgi:hypothetical protein